MWQVLLEIPVPWLGLKIPIYGFGMMLFLAFVGSSWMVQRLCRQEGLDGDRIVDMGLWMFLAGILGARLLYMVRNPHQFSGVLAILKIWEGGIVFYGGVLAATLVFIFYTRRFRLPVWQVLDVLAPAIGLGVAIGRIGCLLNGCCWGKPSDLPWAITFPAKSIPWTDQVNQGLISETAARSLPVHPTQIYLALAGLALMAATLLYYRHRRHHGDVMALLMLGYAVTRFGIEFLRADEPLMSNHLTMSQNISIVIFGGAFLLGWWRRRREEGKEEG
jgi:phosphatidylglycerol:prolipoprotein diacylglycerol transferase